MVSCIKVDQIDPPRYRAITIDKPVGRLNYVRAGNRRINFKNQENVNDRSRRFHFVTGDSSIGDYGGDRGIRRITPF